MASTMQLPASSIPQHLQKFFQRPKPCNLCYVCHLRTIMAAIWRVLRKDGVVWLNLGDVYIGGKGASSGVFLPERDGNRPTLQKPHSYLGSQKGTRTLDDRRLLRAMKVKPKDMGLVPESVALALRADGWWVRSRITWEKPNPMPESATDRPTSSTEFIWMLAKSSRYYFDMDAVREPHTDESLARYERNSSYDMGLEKPYAMKQGPTGSGRKREKIKGEPSWAEGHSGYRKADGTVMVNELGRHLRDVWRFPTSPSPEQHFAAFPEKLPELCILASTKEGDLVLDPFCGTGTTLAVAEKLGRAWIGFDISEEYLAIARRRTSQRSLTNWRSDA